MSDQKISINKGKLTVPDKPTIPFIEGDGTGVDIWPASQLVFDSAVEKAYKGKRKIEWKEVLAGEKAFNKVGSWMPEETMTIFREYLIGIKGPLTTPVGGGIRSLNVALRQELDLYACVRPVRYFQGVVCPVKKPADLNVVIFRENIEDVYSGIEWKSGSDEANQLISYINSNFKKKIREGSGIGIKPVSQFGTERLVRRAIRHAIDKKRGSVTLVHKGNIMKFTEGAFKEWGYALAAREFAKETISEDEVWKNHDGKLPAGKI